MTMNVAELPGINTTRARGRKDSDGVEEVLKIKPIKDAAKDGMKLFRRLEEARVEFNEWAKGCAERSNANSSTIKKLIKSSYSGKFDDTKRMIEQQQEIFDAVGEIATGAVTND